MIAALYHGIADTNPIVLDTCDKLLSVIHRLVTPVMQTKEQKIKNKYGKIMRNDDKSLKISWGLARQKRVTEINEHRKKHKTKTVVIHQIDGNDGDNEIALKNIFG